jgi:uncharacterized protein (TIGR02996 family)
MNQRKNPKQYKRLGAEEMSFRRKIRENPLCMVSRLAYADWLEERNDPNGVMIRKMVNHESLGIVSDPDLVSDPHPKLGYFAEPDHLIRRVLLACGRYNATLNPEEIACPKRIVTYESSSKSEVIVYVGEGIADSILIYRNGLIDEACLPYPVWGRFGPRLFAEQPIQKIRVLGLEPTALGPVLTNDRRVSGYRWYSSHEEEMTRTSDPSYLPECWFALLGDYDKDDGLIEIVPERWLSWVMYTDELSESERSSRTRAIVDLRQAVTTWCKNECARNNW